MIELLLIAFLISISSARVIENDLLDYVNVFIGTGGEGFGCGSNVPGASTPRGFVRLSPNTVDELLLDLPFQHFGGYAYSDPIIRRFSHTAMIGPGATDYGNIGVFPVTMQSQWTYDDVANSAYASRYNKSTEHAGPGYYNVALERYNVNAELTTTKRVGVHRYTFKNDPYVEQPYIIFDIAKNLKHLANLEATIQINEQKGEITGYSRSAGGMSGRGFFKDRFQGGVTVYYYAKMNTGIRNYATWNEEKLKWSNTKEATTAQELGALIQPELHGDHSVTLYVAISFISIDQAKKNYEEAILNADETQKPFDALLNEAKVTWRKELGQFEIKSNDKDHLIKFYSALYHSLQVPTDFTEAGQVYMGFDAKVHSLENGQSFYSDMSIWDVHRSHFPLMAFIRPSIMEDIVKSMLLMYQQGGELPKWSFAYGYTGSMIGTHAQVIIYDAYARNVKNFDTALAYEAMVKSSTQDLKYASRKNITEWKTLNFISKETSMKSACLTLAYAYDDHAVGKFAEALGKHDEAKVFLQRSKNYKNVWDPSEKFFCPRSRGGAFDCPLVKVNVFDERYTEGDAWHYRFFVPHDGEGLIDLFGGVDTYIHELNAFLNDSFIDQFHGLPNPYYWAGNEHNLMSPWMFNFADQGKYAHLTQLYTRRIINEVYSTKPDGIPGNDDYSTMSAWYIFAALGFYPNAGSDQYFIGSPVFDEVTFAINGCTIHIIAHNQAPSHVYVSKVLVRGNALSTPFFTHNKHFVCQENENRIQIEFFMSSNPQ